MIRQPDARTAGPADLDAVTTTISLAFADDPVWGPAMGGARTSAAEKAELRRLFLAGAIRYPWTRLLPGATAVSVWIPPGGSEMSDEQEEELDRTLARILGSAGATQIAELVRRFEVGPPRETPHAHLS